MGGTVSSRKPRGAVIRGSSPTRLKPFKSKATGLYHCTHLPSTAKMSTALGLLQWHGHGPWKPQSILRHPGGATGCCRAVCLGGDKLQEEVTATCHQLQAELLLCETRLTKQKSSCSRGLAIRPASVSTSSVTAAAVVFLLETQISVPKSTTHSMRLHRGLPLIPICSSSLINKPRLQTTWPGTSFKTTHHWTAHHQS